MCSPAVEHLDPAADLQRSDPQRVQRPRPAAPLRRLAAAVQRAEHVLGMGPTACVDRVRRGDLRPGDLAHLREVLDA